MNVTRIHCAPEYFPPGHFFMRCVRLQGKEAGASDSLWIGMSTILPGGHTSVEASDVEKHYVVLAGEVTVMTNAGDTVLRQYDSCRLAPGERRALRNFSDYPAKILLAMPLHKPEPA